jgi:putative nucleotidyltransferase with HDIG domain
MDEFAMLDNIKDHSIMVARVADALLAGLQSDTLPARDLVLAGALLHDIAKTQCIKEHCDHSKVGNTICLELGYPEIAEIILEHVILADFPTDRYQKGIFLAKEIVHYADKRVLHDQVVSLDTRLGYILKRYGNGNPLRHRLIADNFRRCQDLEGFLFAHNQYTPDQLPALIPDFPSLNRSCSLSKGCQQ